MLLNGFLEFQKVSGSLERSGSLSIGNFAAALKATTNLCGDGDSFRVWRESRASHLVRRREARTVGSNADEFIGR